MPEHAAEPPSAHFPVDRCSGRTCASEGATPEAPMGPLVVVMRDVVAGEAIQVAFARLEPAAALLLSR